MSAEVNKTDYLDIITPRENDDFQDWVYLAACRGEDTNKFYVRQFVGKEGRLKEQERCREVIAKYCTACFFTQECLQRALSTDDRNMIMGGMTPAERRSEYPKLGKTV